MLCAKTKNGKLVILASLTNREIDAVRHQPFYCPECNNRVIVRAGPKVIPHFAHKATSYCSYKMFGGEGTYHKKGKLLLYQWLKQQRLQPQLEVYIPEINQRPDILFEVNQRKIVIEFQCATIPLEQIRKRNEGYIRTNIYPVWILGSNQLKRFSNTYFQLNSFHLQFIHQFSSELPTKLFYFCPDRRVFFILSDMYMVNSKRCIANLNVKPLQRLSFKQLFTPHSLSKKLLFQLWRKEKRKFRLRRFPAYGKELKWRNWLYDNGLHIEQLPPIVHLPNKLQHIMKVPLWNWQSRFVLSFLHPLKIGQVFSINDIIKSLRPYTEKLLLKELPSLIQDYLSLLDKAGFVQAKPNNFFIKSRPIIIYKHIEHALKADDALINVLMYNDKHKLE